MLPRELALHQRHHLHKAEPNAANVYHHDAIEQGDRRILDARRGANNCGSASRSTRQTRAPSDTNFRAVARPIPPATTFFTVDRFCALPRQHALASKRTITVPIS
jgi:hypothetical protein